jgi:hypothetical protein
MFKHSTRRERVITAVDHIVIDRIGLVLDNVNDSTNIIGPGTDRQCADRSRGEIEPRSSWAGSIGEFVRG